MKKLLLLFLIGMSAHFSASAQALAPAELIKCTGTKDVTAFIGYVKTVWTAPSGHNNWQPFGSIHTAYNNSTRSKGACEVVGGDEKASGGRTVMVKNFEGKNVQVDYTHLELADVAAMRNYLKENGFSKGITTSWETWSTTDVVVEIPNESARDYLKMSIYAKK